MKQWLDTHQYLGISAADCLWAGLAVLVSYLVIANLLKFATARLERIAAHSGRHLDGMIVDVLKSTHQMTVLVVATIIGAHYLDIPDKWGNRLDHLWFVVVGFQLALWLHRAIKLWTRERLLHNSHANPVITTMMAGSLRALLWAILLLAILANMGVNITAFVASLGVGGVAIALAVQSILSDLFASLSIGLDKPFEIGDFIVFGDIAGTIEHIGLKTTRIRSLSGEEVVCGNTELLKNSIHNYKRMATRRIVFGFRVTYEASAAQLRQIPDIVRKAVEATGGARFDRAHFKEFGDSSLNFEAVFIVNSPDYNVYMDIQQQINLQLMQELEALGIQFAFPVRKIQIVPSVDEAPQQERALAAS